LARQPELAESVAGRARVLVGWHPVYRRQGHPQAGCDRRGLPERL